MEFRDSKTVGNSTIISNLRNSQREDVHRMCTSLLSCSVEQPANVKSAINQITILRIHHQITRIIRYLDLMDKLEEKLYSCIENSLDSIDPLDSTNNNWTMLLHVQEKLQKQMIESHKLLQPYLDLGEFSITDLLPVSDSADSTDSILLSPESREKLRNSAQAALIALNVG